VALATIPSGTGTAPLKLPPFVDEPGDESSPIMLALKGKYLAFIHLYTKLHRRAPAEADIQMYFRVSPPSVHQMILTLERRGLIERTPGMPRSIRIILPEEELPELLPNLGSRR
jgi:SOS-response transcriptional repressor LexA